MCGIVGFVDRTGASAGSPPVGAVVLSMLQALACRGPDSAGLAMLREDDPAAPGFGRLRITPPPEPERLRAMLGAQAELGPIRHEGDTLAAALKPHEGVEARSIEAALDPRPGEREVLALGRSLDLVKQVGSPTQLEATYQVNQWRGRAAIGHTRMSTESRIDLSHSQPFWAHGLADVAFVHNGHITNAHRLRRIFERQGHVFYTENDSETIGIFLRDRLEHGRTLAEALDESVDALDGAFTFLVLAPEGLGIVRDRHGFKPLMLAETEAWVAAATEEVALRRALPGSYRAFEPPPGRALLFPFAAGSRNGATVGSPAPEAVCLTS